MPPATATSASPARISAAASMIALRPDPQTRLIVVALVVSGRPARSAAWRAGAWPAPACSTWPIRTSSIGVSIGQAGALDRRADRDAAELDGGNVGQRPAELADRRARGADDVDVAVRAGCWLGHPPNLHRRPAAAGAHRRSAAPFACRDTWRMRPRGDTAAVDDQQIGAAIRTIRQRRRWRQRDLAAKANVSRSTLGRIERGTLSTVPLGTIRKVARALDARIDTYVRWQGGDLSRMVNSRHAAMHEAVARIFAELSGWIAEPEVSFSVYGERGVIDAVAWHPSYPVPAGGRAQDRARGHQRAHGHARPKAPARRGDRARQRRWDPARTSAWVVVADSRTNRRTLSNHAAALRSKLPADGRTIRAWLRQPVGAVNALSFLPSVHDGST